MSLPVSHGGAEKLILDQKPLPSQNPDAKVFYLADFRANTNAEQANFHKRIEDLTSQLEDLPHNGKRVSEEIAMLLRETDMSGSLATSVDLRSLLYNDHGELWLRPLFGYLSPNTQVQLRYKDERADGHMHAYNCERFGIELAGCTATDQSDNHDFINLLRLGYRASTPIQFNEQSQVDLTTETGLASEHNLHLTVIGLANMLDHYGRTNVWDSIEEVV